MKDSDPIQLIKSLKTLTLEDVYFLKDRIEMEPKFTIPYCQLIPSRMYEAFKFLQSFLPTPHTRTSVYFKRSPGAPKDVLRQVKLIGREEGEVYLEIHESWDNESGKFSMWAQEGYLYLSPFSSNTLCYLEKEDFEERYGEFLKEIFRNEAP